MKVLGKSKPVIIFLVLLMPLLFVINNFLLHETTLEEETKNGEKNFPPFRTVNLEGEEVTNEIFFGKTTALLIWTIQADICLETLSRLDEVTENLPPNVQIIGLVGDLRSSDDAEKFSVAKKISATHAKNFQHLAVNDDFFPVLSKVRTVPTTIFVDAQGFLIAQPVIGTDANFILRELNYILEKDSHKYKSLRKIQEKI